MRRLLEGDQILAIDGKALDSNISHQEAIGILQLAKGTVHLVVARNFDSGAAAAANNPEATAVATATAEKKKKDLKGFPSDWCQVEVIELVNAGQGLGFGIIGGQQTGVVVKTILENGVADQDGRLQAGDYILQINEHFLGVLGSDKVAGVLKGTGNRVRLVVARAVDPSNPNAGVPPRVHLPILPATILNNKKELETHLQMAASTVAAAAAATASPPTKMPVAAPPAAAAAVAAPTTEMPEMETLDVELTKDAQGLGITIAGYTCEREELSGIFVKSVNEGSAAHRSGKVAVNDQIIEVDGRSIQGYSNQQAVEMLRSTGKTVRLKLVRYVHGLKFEQLQQAIANSQTNSQATTPSKAGVEVEVTQQLTRVDTSGVSVESEGFSDEFEGDINPTTESAIIRKWRDILGPGYQIVVAQMKKENQKGGLGISLEGTVEKVDGEEQNPHHYIRSVLPNGAVGRNGRLRSGDELLEVNGRKLLGLYHTDVVAILKDLPLNVRMVCARSNSQATSVGSSAKPDSFAERLVKAKSDGSISSTGTETTIGTNPEQQQQQQQQHPRAPHVSKLKSRSLEPLSSLAMWSSEVLHIELVKGERGLGFSILDYQDPLSKEETVIVIRSLVPGGVAQQDGRLIPGDRLMYVNEANLAHASLDEAVQALKGASRGIVRIGVSKPLPVPDSSAGEDDDDDLGEDDDDTTNRSSSSDQTEIRSELSEMKTPERRQGAAAGGADLPKDDEPEERLIGGTSSTMVTTR